MKSQNSEAMAFRVAVIQVAVAACMLYRMVSRRLRGRDAALKMKSHALIKALANISTSPLMICDLDGRIISLNSEAIRTSGISEHTRRIDFERFTSSGPLRGEDGDAMGHFVLAHDVTEQIQMQARLRESELQCKRMFDAHPHPMCWYDRGSHAFLAVNDAAIAQYGFGHAEFMAMRLSDIQVASEEGLAHRDPEAAGIWRHRTKDGREIHVDIVANDVSHGGQDARLMLARDVTSALKLEQALTASQHQLAELTQRMLVQEQLTTRRVAQALHDDLGQRLFACALLLEAESRTDGTAQLQGAHRNVLAQLHAAMKALRSVLVDLRPPFLEDRGLVQALNHEIGRLPPHASRVDLLDHTGGLRWDSHIEYGAFMVAREALLNAIAHAQAHNISILVKGSLNALCVSVEDDGQGIPDHLLAGRPGHLGITGMRERAASLGGLLHIASVPARGARVSLEIGVAGS
jgi:PAS domain S-box-containing protein